MRDFTLPPGTPCLVTGGAGFIGSHLTEALLAAGCRVTVLDNFSTGQRENLAAVSGQDGFTLVEGTVTDEELVARLTARVRVVFHLAAAVGVKLIVERPVETIQINVRGTECVLAAAARQGCRTLVASSSEVYGKGSRVPFAEEDDVVLGATSKSRWAYATSKMVDEFLALAHVAEHGADMLCVRLFNIVGPRQTGRYGMVIPRLIQQALRGEPLTVYGDGSQTRCFADVRDVVTALVGLAARGAGAGGERVFNVGSTEEISIRELAERIRRLTGSASAIQFIPFDQVYVPGFEDMQRRVPDLGRIRRHLGWLPRWTLGETLAAIIAHERAVQPPRLAAAHHRDG